MTSIRTLSIVATAIAMPFLTAVRTRRYIAGDRGKGEPDTGTNHVGFRLVRDVAKEKA
jgi:formylglycine-generating enzyme required for sulfatase activity